MSRCQISSRFDGDNMKPVLFHKSLWPFASNSLQHTSGRAMSRQPLMNRLPVLKPSRIGVLCMWCVIVCVGLASSASSVSAQEWAEKMFSVTSHNFGTVAKGSKTEFRFVYRNLYEEDVHVSSVRTSCGCTQPAITKKLIETHETGEIVAVFNTRTFSVNIVQLLL